MTPTLIDWVKLFFSKKMYYTYRHTNNFVSEWKEKVGGKKLNISNERKNDVMMFMEFENF